MIEQLVTALFTIIMVSVVGPVAVVLLVEMFKEHAS